MYLAKNGHGTYIIETLAEYEKLQATVRLLARWARMWVPEKPSGFARSTERLVSGDTLQLKDYNKLDGEWSLFHPEAKKLCHVTAFPQGCAKARDMGAARFHT